MKNVKNDFPIFKKHLLAPGPGRLSGQKGARAGGQADLVYLDSAATALKPQRMLDKVKEYHTEYTANIHRGLYPIAQRATDEYEKARQIVADFLRADTAAVVFTRGATEAINLAAYSYGRQHLKRSDAVVVSEIEHHSNIVPWHLVAEEKQAKLLWWEMEKDGTLDTEKLKKLLKRHSVKIVAVTGASNAVGTMPPIAQIIKLAHDSGAVVVVDAAQWAVHGKIDVKALDIDFLAFSGHKLYGPTGIGVLYGKKALLDDMPPFIGGGEMIREVTKEKITYNSLPYKFEAGTMPIAQAIGLGAAIQYLEGVGFLDIQEHEQALIKYAFQKFAEVPGLTILGPKASRGPLFSFIVDGIHPHDLGTLLGERGIAVRAGHHCAMPVHRAYGIPASTRASFGIYTSRGDIDKLVQALKMIQKKFAKARLGPL